jgi:hypothetical protein
MKLLTKGIYYIKLEGVIYEKLPLSNIERGIFLCRVFYPEFVVRKC